MEHKLTTAREAREWTVFYVAIQCGVGARTVRDWEAGRYAPKPHARIKLRNLFNMPIEDLGFREIVPDEEVHPKRKE